MKIFFYIFVLTVLCSCHYNNQENSGRSPMDYYEVIEQDTVNKIDSNGRKQGVWYTYSETDKGFEIKDTLYYKDGILVILN